MSELTFIHAADVHLDSPLRGLERYGTAPTEAIRLASRRAFEALVRLAVEENAAFVVLAGDLYDGDWQDYNTGLFFLRQMARLGEAGIRVFISAGNHDAASRISRTLELPEHVIRFGTSEAETILLDELGVAVHGQSFATQEVTDNLARGYPEAVTGRLNVGVLHTSLTGYAGHEPYAPCSLADLQAKGYDYWALGHVHEAKVISEEPWVVFAGCLQGRHARETGAKGCRVVRVRNGEVVAAEHRVLDVLRWARAEVDLADVEEPRVMLERVEHALRREVRSAGERILAVRVELTGATPLHGRLRGERERLVEEIRGVAERVGPERIWVEKVRLATSPKQRLDDVLAGGGPLEGLLRAILDVEPRAESVPGLTDTAQALHQALAARKLGDWMRREDGVDPTDPTLLAELVEEAKQLLISQLLVREEEP